MILKFQGIVEVGDYYRVSEDPAFKNGSIHIGGKDVVDTIDEHRKEFKKEVTVGIADETFTGEAFIDHGWGYSEYTPMDSDLLQVGGHDLLEILSRHEGKEVTMWVSDEPINLLE